MKIKVKDLQIFPDQPINLDTLPTSVKPFYNSKKEYHKLLAEHIDQLSELQQMHYAFDRYAVLVIFQAMDAAGKDGAIRHVMSGINPQGCQVFSFKAAKRGRTRSRFSLASRQASAGAGQDRHLQPFIL